MAGFIAKKIFKETLDNKFGQEDPYYETVPATRLGAKPKRQRKANPPGLSDHDSKVLTKVKRRAYKLDMSLFNCCGIRMGWSSVIGLVPAAGDVLDLLMALMVFKTCCQVEGLPAWIKSKMLFNIVFDFFIGIVPVVGDLADAVFRANTRNAAILEGFLREKGKKNIRASGAPMPAIDPSDPDEFDRIEVGGAGYTSSQPPSRDGMVMTPQKVKVKDNGRSNGRSGRNTPPVGSRASRGSSRPRNELRDMEEGVMSHHPSSASRHQAPTSSRNGKSSRRGH
ncbi:hypothetical protein MKZ38_010745 [Zalerion maritima]|uniref:Uncharacterized protein n=1 Tax=Zalerion maritima TaxID=339359 RepID=A0AAD5RYA6_9PEZI|nr:hypothetical protein MKZ38_010745 [Zalerion maritima]